MEGVDSVYLSLCRNRAVSTNGPLGNRFLMGRVPGALRGMHGAKPATGGHSISSYVG